MVSESNKKLNEQAGKAGNASLTKKEAYRIVFDDLIKCGLFAGSYDARNGDMNFIFGIGTVMENIALSAGVYDFYTELFSKNIEKSKKKAKAIEDMKKSKKEAIDDADLLAISENLMNKNDTIYKELAK